MQRYVADNIITLCSATHSFCSRLGSFNFHFLLWYVLHVLLCDLRYIVLTSTVTCVTFDVFVQTRRSWTTSSSILWSRIITRSSLVIFSFWITRWSTFPTRCWTRSILAPWWPRTPSAVYLFQTEINKTINYLYNMLMKISFNI
jgi:hypothetical protein